jgi:hypothetical protein
MAKEVGEREVYSAYSFFCFEFGDELLSLARICPRAGLLEDQGGKRTLLSTRHLKGIDQESCQG